MQGSKREASAPPGRVRIIGGNYRRTPLRVPAVDGLRPTPDRVRETVFNWLEHLRGGLAGGRVLDLFAGTGVLGLEAASRGAAEVVLVDASPAAAQELERVVARLQAPGVSVLRMDWRAALGRLPKGGFDLVFLDPPYGAGLLPAALAAVRPLLAPQALVYAEDQKPLEEVALAPMGYELVRNGHAGVVYFHLLHARPC